MPRRARTDSEDSTLSALDANIEQMRLRLKALEERKRLRERLAIQKNAKAVHALIQAQRLDHVAIATWQGAWPKVAQVLGVAPIDKTGQGG